jgi:hypothetical protein
MTVRSLSYASEPSSAPGVGERFRLIGRSKKRKEREMSTRVGTPGHCGEPLLWALRALPSAEGQVRSEHRPIRLAGHCPGVTVTAVHEATGNTFAAVSGAAGKYRFGALRIGGLPNHGRIGRLHDTCPHGPVVPSVLLIQFTNRQIGPSNVLPQDTLQHTTVSAKNSPVWRAKAGLIRLRWVASINSCGH